MVMGDCARTWLEMTLRILKSENYIFGDISSLLDAFSIFTLQFTSTLLQFFFNLLHWS